LALDPDLQLIRRSRRPLLPGLEQAHRSALAHHVHRIAPMGARVLINGIRYKVRSLGLLPTSLATRALAIKFQSVTTSARAGATDSAAATMPGSAANFKMDLIVRLLPCCCPRNGMLFHVQVCMVMC